jgi:hypothetical protein
LNIHLNTVAETTSGNSHGTSSRDRRSALRGKRREKKTASASPIVYWKKIDATTKIAVTSTALANCGL